MNVCKSSMMRQAQRLTSKAAVALCWNLGQNFVEKSDQEVHLSHCVDTLTAIRWVKCLLNTASQKLVQ